MKNRPMKLRAVAAGPHRLEFRKSDWFVVQASVQWRQGRARRNLGQVCAGLSRFLLLMVAIELVTMPLTQQVWTWDRFLHGGQDFEFGLLTIVTCLCLGLLRAQHCRQGIKVLLAVHWLFSRLFHRRERSGMAHLATVTALRVRHMADPGPPLLSLPLQI